MSCINEQREYQLSIINSVLVNSGSDVPIPITTLNNKALKVLNQANHNISLILKTHVRLISQLSSPKSSCSLYWAKSVLRSRHIFLVKIVEVYSSNQMVLNQASKRNDQICHCDSTRSMDPATSSRP